MSQYADLTNTFRKAKRSGKITEDVCVDLFIDVMGSIEWEIPNVDYSSDEWQQSEIDEARKILA